MEVVEIRLIKKPIFFIIIAIMLFVMIGMVYYIYFSGKIEENSILKWIYIPLTTMLVYTCFTTMKKLQNNEPVLRNCFKTYFGLQYSSISIRKN
jgi:hypothetical protein